jgi:hypothetical protein
MIKETEVWVEIPYEVCGSVYHAEIYLPDIIEAKKEGGDKAVEKLVEEIVEEDFHQNVYFSYDLYEFTEELDKEYGTKINEMKEDECLTL